MGVSRRGVDEVGLGYVESRVQVRRRIIIAHYRGVPPHDKYSIALPEDRLLLARVNVQTSDP
jgi:hypothetical protein